jgi:hypothetical protein
MVTSEVKGAKTQKKKTKSKKKKTHKKKKGGKKGKGKKKAVPKSKTLVAQNPVAKFSVNDKLDRLGIARESNNFDAKSQPVVVPIDELNAITLKVSP